ncbi:MAG: ABC transporter ATP-binding protein/permease [Oscillospiraceae bacterium]|jgi:ATP-binding cassette subfamily B protein|nr:ABC transporter ATP-binding protein/permease [Oscillospiraceae bacterium]
MSDKPNEKQSGLPEGRLSEYVEKKRRRTLLRLLKYFGVSKGKTALALLFAMLLNVAQIAQPLVVRQLIDGYLAPANFDFAAISALAVGYIAVTLLSGVSGYAQQVTLTSLGQHILHKLRTDLFSHIQSLNMRFFDKNASGRILTRVTSDIDELQELYANIFIMAIREGILIIGMLVTMFALDASLALWCMASVPVVAAITVLYRFIARRTFIRVKTLLSRINGFLAEHVTGMRVVQIFNRERRKLDDYTDMNTEYYRLGLMQVILNSLSNPLIVMISNLMVALLLGAFGKLVGMGALNIGVLYAFTAYIRQLFEPIAQLSEQLTTAQSALISADRVFDILDNTEDEEDLERGTIREGALKGRIEFRNVWFAYNAEEWVLRDVSFTIEPGQHAAFVGATGSGKTTVMSLISRYYIPQRGQILLDGADISEYNLKYLRRQLAIVMQSVFLFSGDIAYNITLGREDITRDDMISAAVAANCDAFIRNLPNEYEHQVAERGSDFSLGQRQLISFARALASKPSVLALDEATASIDTETERTLQSRLEEYARGKTLVIIAHRLSTVTNSDVIFVMDHGQILERGDHATLMARENGAYRKLYLLSIRTNT